MKDYCGKTISANYVHVGAIFKTQEAIGGKLSFDESGMEFNEHKLNVRSVGTVRIEYADIKEAKKRGILNGMDVVTNDGTVHMLVVSHRKDIIEFIMSKIG
ncbi:MAG: hypothetical protein IJ426_00355 [Clostridia bacterium]|nr:hypothetical protein [Clostridia bacterium]